MATRHKRTYNLSEETLTRVRELAGPYGAATSQDRVVELAVERLYRDVQDREEADRWAQSAQDPEFRAEVRRIADTYRDRETWPK